MRRGIDSHLVRWKNDPRRKVLLVRGARQVGKTYSVRRLGRSFESIVEVNFEEHPEVGNFFSRDLSPGGIIEKLAAYFGKPIKPGRTLLFFDEVQACPGCLRSLRFFHERMPDLHVIAAGSLLEFVLSEIPSFGVGRISSLFMYPLSFTEFLEAVDMKPLADAIRTSRPAKPLDNVLHRKALDHLRTFCAIGGMPAVVETYASSRDIPACRVFLDDIIEGLRDDFSKYRKSAPTRLLAETFEATTLQAGGKFVYRNVNSDLPHHELKNALELLVKAGLARGIFHSDARGIPLGAQMNQRRFKVLPFDCGIAQRMQNLDISSYLVQSDKDLVNKGAIAEVFCGLEMIANAPPHQRARLFYWHREARQSNAEVDYVIQQGNTIVPVEIKAGSRGSMQSIRLFLNERNLTRGIRLSHENYSSYNSIEIAPLYTAGNLVS